MEIVVHILDHPLFWQVLSGLLAAALLLNLVLCHKDRLKSWRKKRLEKAMQHNGISGYQDKMQKLAKDNAELARAPYDTTGIDVEMGLRNGERGDGEEELMEDLHESIDTTNVIQFSKTVVHIPGAKSGEQDEYGWEEYLMGKPTRQELDDALAQAAHMREGGMDEHHLGKCLLNLNYRNKLLENVLQHAELYVRNGSDPHQHTLLVKAIKDVEAAGQEVKHDDESDGTFMIS